MDMVYLIGSFWKWKYRVQPISKQWLCRFLKKKIRLNKWKSKIRIYSYMRLNLVPTLPSHWLSWKKFAKKQLQLKQRKRDRHFNLSWKASVIHFMTVNRCKSCGRTTKSNVFGTHLCLQCRQNPLKVNAYMITTTEAMAMGLSRQQLALIPYHSGTMRAKVRFEVDVLQAVDTERANK